ncbi:MAG: outer membrane beta-barrel protein [Bacteroidota bacterium]
MKKILLSFSLIIGLLFSAMAQKQDSKYKISVGAEVLIPSGSAAEYNGTGYGASVQGEYKLLPNLSATLSGAYISLPYSKLYKEMVDPWLTSPLKNRVYYPVKGGAKYYFGKYFYGAAEAGASITTDVSSATSFAYAGGLGTSLSIAEKSNLDLGIRYETWALSTSSTVSFIGVRAAYAFGF